MAHEYNQGGILTDAVLEQILQAACYAIAESIESIGRVQLTVPQVDQIPGAVYEFGVEAGFLMEPDAGPHGVQLGSFTVPREYREWFIRKIQFPLSQLRELPETDSLSPAATPPIEWERPTPQEIIDDYKADTGLGDGKIAEAAGRLVPKENPDDEDPISWRTILRIRNNPGYQTRPFVAQALARLMGRTHWRELLWRRKKIIYECQ